MQTIIKGFVVVLLCACGSTSLLADDYHEDELSLSIEKITSDGRLTIGMHNISKKDVHVWIGDCGWAWSNWRVLDVRNGETRLYAPDPREDFTMNYPQAAGIKPGQMRVENLMISDKWEGGNVRTLTHIAGPKDTHPVIKDGDKIIVIYDVGWSAEATKFDAWLGLTEVSKDFQSAAKN